MMSRRLGVLIILVLAGVSVHAQSLQWVFNGDTLKTGAEITITTYDPVMGQMTADLGIYNEGVSDLSVTVNKNVTQPVQGSSVLMCVGETCYSASANVTNAFSAAAGKINSSFHASYEFSNGPVNGTTTTVFTVSSGTNSAAVTVHFKYEGSTASEVIKTTGTYQARSSDHYVYMSNSGDETVQVQVVNIQGKTVYSGLIRQGEEIISGNLYDGLYIVAFYKKGALVEAKKLIVK